MKSSSRNENVHSAIGKYMKTRQYSDVESFRSSELKCQQTVEEMALEGEVQLAASSRHAICFSSVSGDATAIDQQFSRLKIFIAEASEPFRSELSYLLFPMFVHLYLELITNGQKTAAQKFHSRHVSLFMECQEYSKIVENLGDILTLQDISNHTNITNFRENKYSIAFSDDCYEYLLRFLRNIEHLTLLQLLNLCFDVEILHSDESSPENSAHFGPTSSPEPPGEEEDDEEAFVDHSMKEERLPMDQLDGEEEEEGALAPVPLRENALFALRESIRRVREAAPCLPSVCLHTLHNASQGVSSVCLSDDDNLLAAGLEDSSVRLWSLTPDLLHSRANRVNVSRVRLAFDNRPDLDLQDDSSSDVHSKASQLKVMRGHSGPVYGINFVPNCDVILSCSQDATVRAWSLKSHSNVALYRGHAYPVFDIATCPQGLYFATASADTTARIWTLDRIYPLRILAGHTMDVHCVAFHPNSNYLATGSNDRSLRLWSVQDGRMVRLFQGHRASILAIAFSPDGKLLASAGEDRRIKIWELSSGSALKELRGHTDSIHGLCFSSNSCILASSGLEHTLRIWDLAAPTFYSSSSSSAAAAASSNSMDGTPGGDGHTSPELLASFPTNAVPVPYVKYSARNMLQAVGIKTWLEQTVVKAS